MKRVVVTGASGYIGGELTKRFLQDGASVWGVGRNADKLNALAQYGDFRPVIAGFEDYDKLDSLIPERGFDLFYHLAWYGTSTKEKEYNDYNIQLDNVKASCGAAHSAMKLACRRCFCSNSNYQEAIALDLEKKLENRFNPVCYGIIHRTAAEMFKAIEFKHGVPCINLIFPNTYGVGDKPNTAIMFFIRNLLQNKPLNLISGIYADDWMPVTDLVDGIIAAIGSNLAYGDYYIGHKMITTFKEKLTEMKQVLHSNSKLNFGEYPESYYVDYSHFDLDALHRDTGWEAKASFRDSILETAEWIRSQA